MRYNSTMIKNLTSPHSFELNMNKLLPLRKLELDSILEEKSHCIADTLSQRFAVWDVNRLRCFSTISSLSYTLQTKYGFKPRRTLKRMLPTKCTTTWAHLTPSYSAPLVSQFASSQFTSTHQPKPQPTPLLQLKLSRSN